MNVTFGFGDKVTSADDAVKLIESGDRVWVHPGCAEPERLVKAMLRRKDELQNVEILHILTLGNADYVNPEYAGHFWHRGFFIGHNVRDAVNEGRASFVPIHLSQIESLLETGRLKVDTALIHVTTPDEHGFCSLGVGVEMTLTVIRYARKVIAQMNPRMPRTLGDSFVHVRKFDKIVFVDDPVCTLTPPPPSEIHKAIANQIAPLIEDGATLQMGIGAIPDAVLPHLTNLKHLGVHTEMFSDGLIPLIEMGVVDGEEKTIHKGKIVASFVLGTEKAFSFVDNNPLFEFHPTKYVNDPAVIRQNNKMVSINSAIEVDLYGQVVASCLEGKIYSGFGGQVDFIRGASRSLGGKAIIALPSTARGGKSRIVPTINPRNFVTTSCADVRYIATEWGVVDLFGKDLGERAKALISVAHPDVREDLYRSAREMNLLPREIF